MKTVAAWLAVLLVSLAGCGGGGYGGSNSNMPGPMQNLQSAPAPQEPYTIASTTLTATSNGNTYTATYSETPNPGTTTFNGQIASSSTVTLTVVENGTTISSETSAAYYLTNPYTPLGATGTANGNGFEFLFNSTTPFPTTLTVGTSGPVGSGTYYMSGTNVAIGSLTETYSVVANNSTTVLLKVFATGTLNGTQISETINYTVDASGHVTLLSVQITVNGVTLTFT
jgi:hypothetical protein